MRWGAGRRAMLAAVVAGMLLAHAARAETLQDYFATLDFPGA